MIHTGNHKGKKSKKGAHSFSSPPHMGPASKKPKKSVSDSGWTALEVGSQKVRRGYMGKAPADPRLNLGKAYKKQPSKMLG